MGSGEDLAGAKPSILATAETLVDETAIDGLAAGVVVKDGKVGAEVTAKLDVGKPGGWMLGAVARTNDRFVALLAKWQPKK